MRSILRLAALAAALMTMLVAATSASADPAPGYEQFANCPDKSVNANIAACVKSTVTSGHLQLGTKTTPITDPITLSGGATSDGGFVLGAFDGGVQRIPGGLTGITGLDWLSWLFPFSLLTLDANTQLAGTPGNPLNPQFPLPIKVKLISPLLNNTCFIGSDSNPISLNLTKGTTSPPAPNQPITGSPGNDPTFDPATGIVSVTGIRLVDNAFAAPAANGCGLLLPNYSLINTLVNAQAGLPAAAGTNETIQNAEAALAAVQSVYPPNGIE